MHTKAKTRLMLIWLILASVLLCAISVTLIFANTNSEISIGEIKYENPDSLSQTELESLFTFKSLSDTEVSITAKSGATMPTTLIIPKTYNGKTITTIADSAFSGQSSMEKIVIQDNITSIGDKILDSCSSLTTIEIISENAKYHSSGNCIIETASKTLIAGCKNSVIPTDGSVTSIGSYAFYNCTGLTSITISSSVTSIGDNAFYSCSSLKILYLPDSVRSIGSYAFYNCGLTTLSIPNGVRIIGGSAFRSCYGLTSVTIPSYVTSIGNYAFSGCGLNSISGGNSTYKVVNNCLINTSSKTLMTGSNNSTIPTDGSVTKIEENAFFLCGNLTSITIPSTVTTIGTTAFGSCHGLTSITIPGSVTNMGTDVFRYCSGLTSAKFESGITSIPNSTFYYCRKLTSVTIPSTVTSIDKYAFYDCNNLTTATSLSSVVSIGKEAFYNCADLTSITISSSVTSIGDQAFSGCGLNYIYGGNSTYKVVTNCLINTSSKTLIKGSNNSVIPTDSSLVTSIDIRAFWNCSSLESIDIPSNITYIGGCAFYCCDNLKSANFATTSGWKANGISINASILEDLSDAAYYLRSYKASATWLL